MLLAIDTATQQISLALHDGETLLAEQSWYSANHHSTELALAIQALLRHAERSVDALTAVAVASGPGAFTGLRIGVALAKGLASARGLPLVGVSTLDILALAQPNTSGGLIVVAQAGRSRILTAAYQWRKGHWKMRAEPQIMDWETLIGSIDGTALITGEIDATGREAITAAQGRGATITLAPPVARLRRAGYLAEEAWTRLRENRSGHEPAKLIPIYAKTKDSPV